MDIQRDIDRLQEKLQAAMTETLEKVEKAKLRPLQRGTHLKIADCYGMKNASSQEVQNCVNAQARMSQAVEKLVNGEIEAFQHRVQRCANACQDDFQSDNMNNRSGVPTDQSQRKFVSCFASCVDKNISALKPLQAKLESDIDSVGRL